eukprot:c29422_g1_i1 orf=309-926(-)
MAQQQGSAGCSLSGVKLLVVLLALGLAVYIVGRPLYWQLVEALAAGRPAASCPPCFCDCNPTQSMPMMPSGFDNTSNADCGTMDLSVREELDKSAIELLTEELKLQETVAKESEQRADLALLDAKKVASQYQKEAEKCNAGMETCEGAREKAEAAFIAQKKLSTLWEQRARELGWQDTVELSKVDSRTNEHRDSTFGGFRKHAIS